MYSPPAPPPSAMADGVHHQARGLEATGCCPRRFGRGETRTGVVGVSLKWQHATFWHSHPQLLLLKTRRHGTCVCWWLVAEFPYKDHAVVSAAITTPVLESATDVE